MPVPTMCSRPRCIRESTLNSRAPRSASAEKREVQMTVNSRVISGILVLMRLASTIAGWLTHIPAQGVIILGVAGLIVSGPPQPDRRPYPSAQCNVGDRVSQIQHLHSLEDRWSRRTVCLPAYQSRQCGVGWPSRPSTTTNLSAAKLF